MSKTPSERFLSMTEDERFTTGDQVFKTLPPALLQAVHSFLTDKRTLLGIDFLQGLDPKKLAEWIVREHEWLDVLNNYIQLAVHHIETHPKGKFHVDGLQDLKHQKAEVMSTFWKE